ncbi:ABC-type transport auxiliary lipoprotein family protein [Pseudoxanthomonas sangjuensis]|uniref:ABC-type transport auxiliary lipoprotein family protein n=1 Tax=Pseudoxanthomonas sangjuensis TaxID=1503750 RepID=UPI0013918F34|nr:ABC-type transport auxiliary lipoprotein family protein [Pseudoxanthomonas sangjuensis]KAF1708291.1 ABC transporter [Pseudoxanthomonas sangjuensis]
MIERKDRRLPTPQLRRIAFRAVVLAFATGLSGCSILGSGPREGGGTTIYAPDVRVAADPSWPQVDWSLAIAPPTAPRMLDSTRIAVRPTPGELQVYRGASWSQPPTALVADAVLHALEDSGKIASVARQGSGIRADYKLVLDIRRFEADYAGKAVPDVVIEINAKLLSVRNQTVVVSHTFVQTQPTAGKEAPQVAGAFEQLLSVVAEQIAGWLLNVGARP